VPVKKYGLIWDEEKVKEQFEKDAENALPVLKEIKSKEIKDEDPSKPVNILIEGDNYHALSVLNFTHQGKIDVIYIDPPYNTGAKNWLYNNDFVDKDDEYRHSKWISFMAKRLQLAKNLLTDDGVLVCAIDENEHAHLLLLLESIFSSYERHSIVVVHNPKGVQGTNFSYTHEYAVFVIPKNKKVVQDKSLEESEMYISNLRNWGAESLRTDAKNCFYPIRVKHGKIIGFGNVVDEKNHPKSSNEKHSDEIWVWPIDEKLIERKWRYARQSVEEIINVLRVETNKKGVIQIFIAKNYGIYKTVWVDKKYDASEYGTKLLRQIIPNCEFDFPKSLFTVYDCIFPLIKHKKDAIVLDFFAGSGTTGHAVMEINNLDKGSRQFILCTNNENNICEKITYERIRRIISGYKKKDEKIPGFGGCLKYFKTKFVKTNINGDDFRTRITNECTEMLCLCEGIFDEIKTADHYRIFQLGNKTLAVYYSLERQSLPALKKELDKIDGDKILYCFTLDEKGLSKTEFSNWHGVTLEPIPQKILDVYKQIYEY
jgi:adenine-specific DNA-methyltransferase